jgi:Cu+-exporting ATPase
MDTLRLIVSDVTTGRDRQRIEAALRSLKGVRHASVDLDAGWVTITYDPQGVGVWTIVTAIERLGCSVDGLMPTTFSDSTPPAGR